MPKPKTDTGKLKEQSRRKLAAHVLRTMIAAYSESEFNRLCWDMGIDYESIKGETKPEKMLEFVKDFYRHNRLEVLADFLAGDRPEHKWRIE